MARTARFCAALSLAVALLAGPARALCTGDCDGDDAVAVDELVAAVAVALGASPLAACLAIDRDRSATADIDELLAAVAAALGGCPAAASPTATPTPIGNQPPVLPTASIYRGYPGLPIALPLAASDPEGGAVECEVDDLPPGATFDPVAGILNWTPAADQLGAFSLPYRCRDDAAEPATASGQLILRISPFDACSSSDCDPATGCPMTLPPVDSECCAAEPTVRVPEPVAGCPEGRVLYVGQNRGFDSFGRLQNCDPMSLRHFLQSGAEARFHIEARCMNTAGQVRLHGRMESTAVDHPLLFDTELFPFELAEYDDGFARFRNLRFAINGPGPFFDVQDADANLTLTLTDADGVAVSHSIRLRLTFTPRPTDLPDVDPTLPPTPTRTVRP